MGIYVGLSVFLLIVLGIVSSCILMNKREVKELCSNISLGREDYCKRTLYEKYIKRVFDIVISFLGILVLWPVILVASAIVFIEDPGKVIYKQKRVGENKSYFYIHKIRTMRLDTPDIPTHLMKEPEKYILKVGKIYRKYSIDELVQLFDIVRGKMSIVGPRPALWNQEDLIAERDKYQANSIKPGLTGWAQINGRDELEIPVKAKLDGEYASALNTGKGLRMDIKCFFGSISVFAGDKSVVEGGTGGMKNAEQAESQTEKKEIVAK